MCDRVEWMKQMEKQAVDWVREGWLERGPSLLGGGDLGGGWSGNPSPHGNKEQNLDLFQFVWSHHTKEGREGASVGVGVGAQQQDSHRHGHSIGVGAGAGAGTGAMRNENGIGF